MYLFGLVSFRPDDHQNSRHEFQPSRERPPLVHVKRSGRLRDVVAYGKYQQNKSHSDKSDK